MNLLDNKPLLIGVGFTLAIIKFALIPVFVWQEEQTAEIIKQEKQLEKGLRLLENKEQIVVELGKLKQLSEQQLKLIATPADSAISYQLQIQKMIENLMEKYQLSSRSSNWLNPVVKNNIEEHRLEISLSGNTKELIQFFIDVEQQTPKLTFIDLHTNISKMYPNRNKLGRFTGKFIIVGWRMIGEVDGE